MVGVGGGITEHNIKEDYKNDIIQVYRGTVRALQKTGEILGIYPQRHPERIASLSAAIAEQLGFTETETEVVRIMGLLHDIGKAAVPREILCKPIKLNNLESQILKIHPKISYEIVNEVGFPCPIATAVLQHHEMLDGSGYPNGIKEEEIIKEARILIVAEVVENFTCHQAYRPAIGLEPALEEIEKNRGVLYDKEIVNVCIKLFREKGFRLE